MQHLGLRMEPLLVHVVEGYDVMLGAIEDRDDTTYV